MTPRTETLTDGHLWLRVVDPDWEDPLDMSFARVVGGRWNPPGSYPTLYLNENLDTARAQVVAVLAASPVQPEDLDTGFDLVEATLPRSQEVADAVSADGLESLGLPPSYPRHRNGRQVGHEVCQPIGHRVWEAGLRGVHARSAVTEDGAGRELAWFPARTSSRAVMQRRLAFRDWWFSSSEDVGGPENPL